MGKKTGWLGPCSKALLLRGMFGLGTLLCENITCSEMQNGVFFSVNLSRKLSRLRIFWRQQAIRILQTAFVHHLGVRTSGFMLEQANSLGAEDEVLKVASALDVTSHII